MDTKNDPPKSWSKLTAAARQATPPPVDVADAVMREIRTTELRDRSPNPPSLIEAVSDLFDRRLFKPALATVATLTVVSSYGLSRRIDYLEFVNSFIL